MTKSQISTKFQILNIFRLEFDYWNLFGACNLVLGA
jgi:hypothetical protein